MPLTPADPRRVALYARVSTVRQAEAELSIPDQIRQGEDYCRARGMTLVETFVEAGASATDDRRPEFQRMIEAATSPARPFDAVLVHSMSRFFREQHLSEMYVHRLRKAGVAVVSMTQDFAADATGNLIRQILGSFDEYQSRENGKHTLRAMQENARQGFWNGSKPPFGYLIVEAERRGAKAKKRLAIDPAEAGTVRMIYELALGAEGVPLGVKAIVTRLNAAGMRNRGKPFHISSVHRILTSETYAGRHAFNRLDAKTKARKPADQHVEVDVPALVSAEEFEIVQASLRSRSPKRTPPRVVSGPTLLTGLARCASCGSGMTIRTGKGGRYRYYTCAGCAQKGKTACSGRSVPMAALDGVVLDHLADKLFTPARLTAILEASIARSETADADRAKRLAQSRRALTEAQGRVSRLLEMIENGLIGVDDPQLRERMDNAKLARRQAEDEVRVLEAAGRGGAAAITPQAVERLSGALRGALAADDPSFRKAYLRLFVSEIVVDDEEVRMTGPTSALAKAAMQDRLPACAELVPSFVREWRPVGDSNPCRRRERAVS